MSRKAAALSLAAGLLFSGAAARGAADTAVRTLTNPVLPSGADPWVTSRDGFYYYMNTTGDSLDIRKTRSVADLEHTEMKLLWKTPASDPYSRHV